MRNVEGEKKKKKKNEQRAAEGFLNLEGKNQLQYHLLLWGWVGVTQSLLIYM